MRIGTNLTDLCRAEEVAASNASVVEISPQHICNLSNSESLREMYKHVDLIAETGKQIVVHSVDFLVGDTLKFENAYLETMKGILDHFECKYFTDHLSFHRLEDFETDLFLPLPQNIAGVKQACRNIDQLQTSLGVRVGVEVGCSYLPRYADEMSESEFYTEIADRTGCLLLLDLNNVLINHYNGRQSSYDFLNDIDLGKVCQVHLAGGHRYINNIRLDSHGLKVDKEVTFLYDEIRCQIPDEAPIIWELFPPVVDELSEYSEIIDDRISMLGRLPPEVKAPPEFVLRANQEQNPFKSYEEWTSNLIRLTNHSPGSLSAQMNSNSIDVYRFILQQLRLSQCARFFEDLTTDLLLQLNEEGLIRAYNEYVDRDLYKRSGVNGAYDFLTYISNG